MVTGKKVSNYERIQLTEIDDIRFTLVVPSTINKDQYPQYYLEYYACKKLGKVKGGVKSAYLDFKLWLKSQPKLTKSEKEEKLLALFQVNINQILGELALTNPSLKAIKLTIYSGILDAVNAYFEMQKEQHARNELADISNYTDRNKRLNEYFKSDMILEALLLKEMNADIWEGFRTYLRMQGLVNSSINQYITYVKSFYNWLIDFKEIPIVNHPKKLKKLDTSQQKSKYRELTNGIIEEFYAALNGDNDKWLRLNIMARLVTENTVRPVQVRRIQAKYINLSKSQITIYDYKSKKWRTIIITEQTKELIKKIYSNTEKAQIEIEPDDYLFGGENRFKKGKPQSQGYFRDWQIKPFRNAYPKFKDVQVYDFKATTITRTSKNDLVATQKRAGHAKASTTQIYDKSDRISQAIPVEELLKIG